MTQNRSAKAYLNHRLKLEESKRKTWRLLVASKCLIILAELISYLTK
jgi:hypothetical protein